MAAPVATPVWSTGFENGFPGEFLDYDDGSYSPSGQQSSGTQTWAIVDASQGAPVFAGEHVYKGWIHGSSSDSHRAYPVIHVDFPTPLVNSFMVYLDADYSQMANEDWIHLGTWGNDPNWTVHTMAVRARKLELAHLQWEYVGPKPQPDFPLRRWVRMTVYLHYQTSGEQTVVVWQDGVLIMRGRYTDKTGRSLMRAHWGMYANGGTDQGTQYNDEIQIWRLSEPLTDFTQEPESPYGMQNPNPGDPPPDPMPSAGAGGRSSMGSMGQGGRFAPRGGAGGGAAGAPANAGAGSAGRGSMGTGTITGPITGAAGARPSMPPTTPADGPGSGGSFSASPGSGVPLPMPGAPRDSSAESAGCSAAPGAQHGGSLWLLAFGVAVLTLGRRKRR